jgi:hypothetical protein
MSARRDGFTLEFTSPVDPTSAGDPASYSMDAWTYILQADYGSPEVDQATLKVTAATVSPDQLKVHLTIDGLVQGHVHHLKAPGVRSSATAPLWHPEAFYTLNEIPR